MCVLGAVGYEEAEDKWALYFVSNFVISCERFVEDFEQANNV